MNDKQKKVLKWPVAAIVLILLFPPFIARRPNNATENIGYGFIANPPTYYGYASRLTAGTINFALLFTQWGAVVAVGAAAFFLAKNDKP